MKGENILVYPGGGKTGILLDTRHLTAEVHGFFSLISFLDMLSHHQLCYDINAPKTCRCFPMLKYFHVKKGLNNG